MSPQALVVQLQDLMSTMCLRLSNNPVACVQIGLYLLLASGLGGMLLPALIIIPAHIIR